MLFTPVIVAMCVVAPSAPVAAEKSARPSAATISVSSTEAEVGATVTIRGRVTPRHKGDPVVLQKRVRLVWQRVATSTVRGKGGYQFSEVVGQGTIPYRVRAPRVAGARATTSQPVRVTGVVPAAPLTPELLATYQDRMLTHVNALRAEHELPPVVMLPEGNVIAQAHAEEGYSAAQPRPLLERFRDIMAVPSLFAGGAAAVCEGRDHTPLDGPDRSDNTNYLIRANTAAVGYYYDETTTDGKRPVWIVHLFNRPTTE